MSEFQPAPLDGIMHLTERPSAGPTPTPSTPLGCQRVAGANAAPRCRAHSSRTGNPCRGAAIRGGTVCTAHGGRAPQVREAARLRLALLVDPALARLHDILRDKHYPQLLSAIKEVLSRNDLYGLGVEPKGALSPAQAISVQTQVNLPEGRVASMSDEELDTYQKLLLELRELLPAEEPKFLPGTRRR